MSKKLKNQEIIDLHSAINGMSSQSGIVMLKGLLQYEDHSEGYSGTLKLMKIIEKISVVYKAWQHLLKNTSEDKERVKKLNEFLETDSDIVFKDEDKLKFTELDSFKDDKKKMSGELILKLRPILLMTK